ncbi:hypothetical protein PHYSODRAFT_506585, partial [Phytophthora sojae]
PRSKIHCAASRSSPLACWAPPRRKECEVRLLVAPAGSATRFKKRLTYAWTPSSPRPRLLLAGHEAVS